MFVLYDHIIKAVPLYGEDLNAEYYYVTEGLDWEFIDSIVVPYPALNVLLKEENDIYGNDLITWVNKLWRTANSEKVLILEGAYPDGEYHGLYTHEPYPYEATFRFSHELAEPFSVLVESWDHSTSYTVSQSEMRDGFTMDLPDYPAHYTIYASFRNPDGTGYEAEFWFNIGAVGSE